MLCGELDLAVAARVGEALADHEISAVELSGVTFMDSVGLHALLEARYDRERTGGTLRIVAASAAVRRLFELVGLTELLDPPE